MYKKAVSNLHELEILIPCDKNNALNNIMGCTE
jgi:hypothetical protein